MCVVEMAGVSNILLIGSILTLVGCFARALSIVWLVSRGGQCLMFLGTAIAGAAQPYFSCTPSILASAWFGRNERTLAATVAYNSNNAGAIHRFSEFLLVTPVWLYAYRE